MRLSGKAALITGAGSGIGRATALLFAREGARVAVNDLVPERAAATVAHLRAAGAEAVAVPGDVTVAAEARRAVERTVEAFGRIDIAINNAGVIVPGRVDDMPEEEFDRVMRVNVKGAFLVSKFAVAAMRRTGGGVVVHNASAAALKGFADRSGYSASKGALVSLTRAMAVDHVRENIRVNCVCAGTTDTPALEERMRSSGDPSAARAALTARQPMGRLGREEEIAQAFLFACMDGAAYMTGSVIVIDGGATL